jgi:acetoin utilization deacetylase AcuC-like enzyme
MKKVGYIYNDIYLEHVNPPFHPENEGRLVSINKALKDSGLAGKLVYLEPRKASDDEILTVHDKSYLDMLKRTTVGYLDGDTYKSEGSLEAAYYAAGALLVSLDAVKEGKIERAFCAVRPPGHHAERNAAMGFCIFNNVAVAARYGQKLGYEKVFIVDFDVHHGNATQHMFESDSSVFYFSTHQYPHYPGTGARSETGRGEGLEFTFNFPMSAGSGDHDYLDVYKGKLPDLVKEFSPSIMFVSAGYDLHQNDPLSSIAVSTEGIRGIVRSIIDSCPHVPFIVTLEGGYNHKALSESVVATIEELMK